MAKVKNPIKGAKISGYVFTKRTIKKVGGDNYSHNVRAKKKSKKNNKLPISKKFMLVSPHILTSEVAVFNSEISKAGAVLGGMASALSVAIPDRAIFNDYRSVLDTQNVIINSVDKAYKTYKDFVIPTVGKLELAADKINSILSPMSGAIVDLGLNIANASKLYEGGILKLDNFLNLQKLSSVSFDTIKEQQELLLSNLEVARGSFEHLFVDPSTPYISMMATGLDMATRAIPTFPSEIKFPMLEIIRKETFLDTEEISEAQKMLDGMLKKIGHPELIEIRRGCWETFFAKRRDHIRQASSSMRGLVDTFLREIAPKEKVVDTEYFKNSPDAKTEKGQPTRKAKIYYAVNYDQKKAKHLERLTRGFDEFCQNLNAWDHEPLKNEQFVYGSFVAIECCMIQLLSEIREEN